MKIVQEQILFECLEQFEAGASVEKLMANYPQAAAEIERFLAVAEHLQGLNLQPGLAAKRQSQKLFLQQAAQLRVEQRQAWFTWPSLRRTLMPIASLAMVTILFAVTLLFASASALPGDLLYDAKQWVEAYKLEQAVDATAVFALNAQLNEERVREVKALLRTNETAAVAFEGRINTKQGNNWIIAGMPVRVTEQTLIDGYAEVGALVQVDGRTQNGHLYADTIIVLQEVPATVTPSTTPISTTVATALPTATVTGTPTKPPTATTTQVPAASSTPTTTSMPEETKTPAPTAVPPTATLEPTRQPTAVPPTATAQPTSQPTAVTNDNGNDNDDNSNDNSGNENENDNDDNDNDNGNSGSGSNDNDNDNADNENDNDDNDNDNGNDNGRRDDD